MTVSLPIEEAAGRLGIHPATLRRRLRKGAVQGKKQQTASGYVWLVEVPDEPAIAAPTQPAVSAEATPTLTLERDALAQQVRRLSAHVDDLRTQLESRTREVSELHVILSQTARALPTPALPAPEQSLEQTPTHSDAPPTQEQTGHRGWWARLSGWVSGA